VIFVDELTIARAISVVGEGALLALAQQGKTDWTNRTVYLQLPSSQATDW